MAVKRILELKIVLLYKLGIALHIRILGCCVGANFARDMIKETATIHVWNKFALITFFLTAAQSVEPLTAGRAGGRGFDPGPGPNQH